MPKGRRWRSRLLSRASPRDTSQGLGESGIAHRGTGHIIHRDASPSNRAEHGESHRQAVVARRMHVAFRYRRSSLHKQIITLDLRLCSNGAKILRDESQTVALLDPQLADLPKDGGSVGA